MNALLLRGKRSPLSQMIPHFKTVPHFKMIFLFTNDTLFQKWNICVVLLRIKFITYITNGTTFQNETWFQNETSFHKWHLISKMTYDCCITEKKRSLTSHMIPHFNMVPISKRDLISQMTPLFKNNIWMFYWWEKTIAHITNGTSS